MKKTVDKVLALLAASMMCVTLSACGEKEGDSGKNTPSETGTVKTYTYTVSPMQGVEYGVYYGPNAYVPNSADQEAARNKIHVWTRCTTCGQSAGYKVIPVGELDFSGGDTVQYSDSDECYDCRWKRNLPSFMWTVKITRTETNNE